MSDAGYNLGITRSRERLRAIINELNGPLHRRAMKIFLAITVAHWLEHLTQTYQIYVMNWPRHEALGFLGYLFPWLVHSEWLHYGYALVMLAGLIILRPSVTGRSRTWWDIALVIQLWHHLEHLLLLAQAVLVTNLFGRSVPTSILQLVFPRAELHLVYNALVFVPMLIAMVYHAYAPAGESHPATCNCSLRKSESVSH